MAGITQKSEVLNYLQTHDFITQKIASDKFGASRLSDIIFRLRKEGYLIKKTDETTKNRYGNSCTYAKYSLMDEGDFGSENN